MPVIHLAWHTRWELSSTTVFTSCGTCALYGIPVVLCMAIAFIASRVDYCNGIFKILKIRILKLLRIMFKSAVAAFDCALRGTGPAYFNTCRSDCRSLTSLVEHNVISVQLNVVTCCRFLEP